MRKRTFSVVLIVPILVTALAGCIGVTTGIPEPPPSAAPADETMMPVVAAATPLATATLAPIGTPLPTASPQPTATPTVVLGMRDTDEMVPAKLVRVLDGTTIVVTVGEKEYVVRYIGVEPIGDGTSATAKNTQLLSGEALKLVRDVSDADAQGRLLRYVYARAYMVNAELARLGYARSVAMPPDTLYQELIGGMEQEAREAKRGLWAKGKP